VTSLSTLQSSHPSTPRLPYQSTRWSPKLAQSHNPSVKHHSPRSIFARAPTLPAYITAPMGIPQDDGTGFTRSPLASPIQFSSSPTELDNNVIAELNEDEEAERIRYRSWREGNPDLKKSPGTRTSRSKSRDAHKLSRKIQATLPKTDGQPISSRSRKSSQYLGLFKEKPTIEEQQPPRKPKRQKSIKEEVKDETKQKGWQSNSVSPRQKQYGSPAIQPNEAAESDAPGVFQALSHGGPQYRHPSTSTISSSRSQPDLQALAGKVEKLDLSPQSPRPRTRETQVGISSFNNFQLPPPAEGLDEKRRRDLKKRHGSNFATPTESAADTDDDEFDREHISSAMYYPHRQVRPDMSPELEGAVRPAIGRSQSAIVPNNQHESATMNENLMIHRSGRSEEVEISLESADDKQLWKGDYPVATEAVDSAIGLKSIYDEQGESSASDFESHDESTVSTIGYDSEEEELPDTTTTTPKQLQSRLVRKHHSRHPLGAVELKPFNHQVGGHSTVYQFSRRAVCKKLNNRENVFYETVEKYHPQLLEFMPR
jgi:inositol-hexakisphosphate 5-kinase